MNIKFRHQIVVFCFLIITSISQVQAADFFVMERNLFFEEVTSLVGQLKNADSQSDIENNKRYELLKKIDFLLKRISSYNFSNHKISQQDLLSVFTLIDGYQYTVLKSDENFLSDLEINKLNSIFDFLRKGIFLELSFDGLFSLRSFLSNKLVEITQFLNYWKAHRSYKSVESKLENFMFKNKADINAKIIKLSLIRERFSSFLGKIDEIFSTLFVNLDQYFENTDKRGKDYAFLYNFTKSSAYCINSFFAQECDPDDKKYEDLFINFSEKSTLDFSGAVIDNQMNIFFAEKFFETYLQGYKIPNFFRKHWFWISVTGLATAGGGVYLYRNWDDIMSDDENSVKSRVRKGYNKMSLTTKNSYQYFLKWLNKKYGFNLPVSEQIEDDGRRNNEQDEKSSREACKEFLVCLEDYAQVFDVSFKKEFNDLKQKKVQGFEGLPAYEISKEDLEKISEAKSVVGKLAEIARKFKTEGPMKVKDAELEQALNSLENFSNGLRGKMEEIAQVFGAETEKEIDKEAMPTQGDESNEEELEQDQEFENDLGVDPENKSIFGRTIDRVKTKTKQIKDGAKNKAGCINDRVKKGAGNFFKDKVPYVKTVAGVAQEAEKLLAQLEAVRERGIGTSFQRSLDGVIESITLMIKSIIDQTDNLGVYGQIYETIIYMVISDLFKSIHSTVFDVTGQIDKMRRDLELSLSWIQALVPVLITSVVVPVFLIIYFKKVLKSRSIKKLKETNIVVLELYRVLNYCSPELSWEELPYKTRGWIDWLTDRLRQKSKSFSDDDKERLGYLVTALKDRALCVKQKMRTIKIEWGGRLLGEQF